jgi:hypothetical protein
VNYARLHGVDRDEIEQIFQELCLFRTSDDVSVTPLRAVTQ